MRKKTFFIKAAVVVVGCVGASLVFAQNGLLPPPAPPMLERDDGMSPGRELTPEQKEELLRRKREQQVVPGTISTTKPSDEDPGYWTPERMRDAEPMSMESMKERREEFKTRMAEHRQEFSMRADETKERISERREELRAQWEERKAKLSERRKEVIQNHIERMVQRMRSAIERLTKIADKLGTRIDILTEGGADTADAKANLAEARELIMHAGILLDASVQLLRQAPDAENPADAIGRARGHFEDVKAAIREAHAALVDILTSLKGRSSIAPGDTGTTTEAGESE